MNDLRADKIAAEILDENPDAVLLENMNSALLGLAYRGHLDPVAAYSKRKLRQKLLADGFIAEDAEEYFDKFVGVWAGAQGEYTPVIIEDLWEE